MKRLLFAAGGAALLAPTAASAHGIGGLKDLPVPISLFYYGGAIVLVLSFAALGVLWRTPKLEGRSEDGHPLPALLQRIVLSQALRVVVGAISLFLFGIVLVAALFGDPSSGYNIAPTFVWVLFWLGTVPLVVIFGDVWRVLSPWAAAADAAAWISARFGGTGGPAAYPERLGRWPAAAGLFLFAAFELAWKNPADPLTLAMVITLYSVVTWYGMFVFGRRQWLAHADPFSVYFGLLSRLSALAVQDRDGRRVVVVRRPLAALTARDIYPGSLAFVAVMLGSVSFDGLTRATFWQDWHYRALVSSLSTGEWVAMLLNLGGLTVMVAAVAASYLGAVAVARKLAHSDVSLAGAFLWSLVPIALAYAVAHYFSLLVVYGQVAVQQMSDPLGRGWDLFGTRNFRADLTILSPNTVWYVQVGALVVGHVLGLVLAHDRAISLVSSARMALRAQYALLALMVVYTVGGMWLLSQG